jgi:hypothetical protein
MMKAASYIIAAVLLAALPSISQDSKVNVKFGDVGNRVSIIGALGVPIGQIVTIEGRSIESKDFNFTVLKINGVLLPNPFNIMVTGGAINAGLVSLEGYETAGYEGIPPEVCKKMNFKPHQPWGFYVRFEVIHETKLTP